MVKFKKGLLVITLVSLIMLSIRPFSIYADATDGEFDNDSVVGVQVQENEELLSGVQGTRYTFNIILDGFYIGDFQIHVEYDSYNLTSGNWDHYNIDRTVYVCGYDTYFETWMRENWLPPSSITWSASVNNSDQCIYVGRMDSQQLLNTLIQFKNTYSSNSAVTNGFINQLDQKIDTLLSMKQWNIPFESFEWNTFLLRNNYEIYSFQNYYDYSFPIYISRPNTIIYSAYGNTSSSHPRGKYKVIMILGSYIRSDNYTSYLSVDNGTMSNFNQIDLFLDGSNSWTIFSFEISNFTTSGVFNMTYINSSVRYFIPIYFSPSSYNNISTDFALRFGLSNQLLDDLHIVAQGNQASNNSASSLESSTSSFSSTASDVYNVEDQVSSGFSSSMQNIPSSFNFQNNFGSSFVVSASWVRDQFNNMTANNPFGSLITFSLILGVALLIIGRLLS